LPIGEIAGFLDVFTPQAATRIPTAQTTTSTSFTDLGTVGPQLSDIPDGQYLIGFGAAMKNDTNRSLMGVKLNTTEAADTDCVWSEVTASVSTATFLLKTLTNTGSNTITARYRVTGGTGTFENRWLVALRVGNA
jgi:hypothetical protein